nr:MAG TPA: hypothetical protein [Caudoviricetes sp.]
MTLAVEFTQSADFLVEFSEDEFSVDLGTTTVISSAPVYDGMYIVTPKNYEETELETKDKMMQKNVTVKKIPKYEVSNDFGGSTLIIGDEYYGE